MEINNVHYRHILLYYFKKGKQAMEAHKKICRVYGDDALTERVCQKWFVKFRSGDFDVNDARLIQVSRPSIKIYPNRTPHQGQLSCMGVESAMFRVARDDAEKQICDKLKNKLDEFLELENYDWNLAEPQGHASGFITDLIAFLQSTFTCFNYLPDEVAQVACKSACSHIAKAILGILISEDVKQISMGALQQVNLDTIQCEQFAASEPVVGLPEGTLLQYFSQLRQLLDLFMSWDWPTYFHDYGHDSNKYDLVTPNMAVLLLEKLKESDKKTVFSVLKKSERDKKKLLETVLKQLRQLAQTTQQQ